tara:strand:+ start:5278 stop:5958 length:681 start_codon:yes stop_codon:yes gene_type:complete
MKPNIFICGPSGTGKSTSMRNLPPERTVILNVEQKALPFRKGVEFKLNVPIDSIQLFKTALTKAIENPKIDIIVIESFTSLTELIYMKAKSLYDGFDVWDFYKNEIKKIMEMSKNTEKYIIFIGIDQYVEGEAGVEERFIAVDGSWKKKVEKEFVIVIYSEAKEINDKQEYRFITNKQPGYNKLSAKSPMEMLPPIMENDIDMVLTKIDSYYGWDYNQEEAPKTKK